MGTLGEPTAGTVSGAVGKPGYGGLDVRGEVGTVGEPELHKLGAVGKPTAAGRLPILGAEA